MSAFPMLSRPVRCYQDYNTLDRSEGAPAGISYGDKLLGIVSETWGLRVGVLEIRRA